MSAACAQLGLSEAMFYRLRSEVLQAALTDLEPQPLGRPPRILTEEQQKVAELSQRVAELEAQLQLAAVREELAHVLPGVVRHDPSDCRHPAEKNDTPDEPPAAAAATCRAEGPTAMTKQSNSTLSARVTVSCQEPSHAERVACDELASVLRAEQDAVRERDKALHATTRPKTPRLQRSPSRGSSSHPCWASDKRERDKTLHVTNSPKTRWLQRSH